MKINFKEELNHKDRWSIIQCLVLNGLFTTCKDTFDHILKAYRDNEGILDITIKVEGIEADVQKFCEHWQSQVRRMIKEEARSQVDTLFDKNFEDIYDLLDDLKDRLGSEVNKRMEDWERELDFEDKEA